MEQVVPTMGEAEHPLLSGVMLQRFGNEVRVRYTDRSPGQSHHLVVDRRLYYHELFEHDEKWTLENIEVHATSQAMQFQLIFRSIENRSPAIMLANEVTEPDGTEQIKMDDTAQTVELMEFKEPNQGFTAFVAQGHVGGREFVRAVDAKVQADDALWDKDFRYEYAVFRDNESVLFNVRPDETDAKPVTVFYFGARVEQL